MSIGKTLAIEFVILAVLAVSSYERGGLGIGPRAPRAAPYWTGIIHSSRALDWTHVGVEGGIPTYTVDCDTIRPTGIIDWKAKTTYQAGAQISDSRGNLETVQVAGTSGTTEPSNLGSVPPGSWPITNGATTQDGTVTWSMSPGGTDTANVNNAIIACDGRRGIVRLSAGHFYFTAGITFNKSFAYPMTTGNPQMTQPVSYVLLKGQGPMQTYLHFPRRGQCNGDVCVQASTASFTGYATSGPFSWPGGGANWLGTGSSLGSYGKDETTLIVGPWTGTEPDVNDVVFLDQNNDARSICPLTPPNPPYNCTVPGASEVGNLATIVTSVAHGYHVGQCVGVGDMPNQNSNLTVGYNSGANSDKTTICDEPPGSGRLPGLPSWWRITAVGCIVSGSFVDQSSCGANPLIAFQYHTTASGLANNGGGQATVDNGGLLLSSVGGATMVVTSNPAQSARLCSLPVNNNAPNPACLNGEISIRAQFEAKTIKLKTPGGQGSCPGSAYMCYTVDPPLYMNNWRSSQRPGIWWSGKKDTGDGLEGFTYLTEHDPGDGGIMGIRFTNATNGWVRNVRAIEINRNFVINALSTRITAQDNYIGGTRGGASTAYVFEDNGAADTLLMNNICQHSVSCLMTSTVMGRVAAYNYMVDAGYTNVMDWLAPMMTMNHLAAFYNLFEGNNSVGVATDAIHGTGGTGTLFRSRPRGQDRPTRAQNRVVVNSGPFVRGLNFVGNVMGNEAVQNRYTDGNVAGYSGGVDQMIYTVGRWRLSTGAFGRDDLAIGTSLRWGNYDAATQTTRWCATGTEPECSCGVSPVNASCQITSEVPQAFPFLDAITPADHNLPASLFLSAAPAFWTTTWGTPGWPAIGPDVNATGSPFDTTCPVSASTGTGPGSFTQCDGIGHHAYQIPAQICFNNLPVDPQFQRTFVVRGATQTGSSIAGTATLTANNTLNTAKPFTYTIEVTGIDPAGYNGTWQVQKATPTTITYWLPANPGPYISGGMVTTPNYKQFDAHMCYPHEPL